MLCAALAEVEAMDSEAAIAGLGLTFAAAAGSMGGHGVCEVELVPGGRDIEVRAGNRDEYLNLLRRHWLTRRAQSCHWVRRGFTDVLGTLATKRVAELYGAGGGDGARGGAGSSTSAGVGGASGDSGLLARDLMGSAVTYNLLKANVRMDGGLTEASPCVIALWSVVENMSDQERAQFCR